MSLKKKSPKKDTAVTEPPVEPSIFENKLTEDQKLMVKVLVARGRVRKARLVDIQASIEKEIGERLSLSGIHYYLKQIEEEWREAYLSDTQKIKAAELAKLDHLEEEIYPQWERSKQDAQTVTTEMVGVEDVGSGNTAGERRRPRLDPEDGDPREEKLAVKTKEVTKLVGQAGDPRYVHNLLEITEQRAKLLGLYAPSKVAPTDPSGEKEFGALTDAERAAGIAAILDKARDRRDR
jgi:hypothetical protein